MIFSEDEVIKTRLKVLQLLGFTGCLGILSVILLVFTLVFVLPANAFGSEELTTTVSAEIEAKNDAYQAKVDASMEAIQKKARDEREWKMVSRGEFTREGRLPAVLVEKYPKAKTLGTFNVSFYTTSDAGCDDYGAWGDRITPRLSCAIDPRYYKHNTKFYVEGFGILTAHDTGGAIKGNKMDIAVSTVKEANSLGRIHPKVWVLE